MRSLQFAHLFCASFALVKIPPGTYSGEDGLSITINNDQFVVDNSDGSIEWKIVFGTADLTLPSLKLNCAGVLYHISLDNVPFLVFSPSTQAELELYLQKKNATIVSGMAEIGKAPQKGGNKCAHPLLHPPPKGTKKDVTYVQYDDPKLQFITLVLDVSDPEAEFVVPGSRNPTNLHITVGTETVRPQKTLDGMLLTIIVLLAVIAMLVIGAVSYLVFIKKGAKKDEIEKAAETARKRNRHALE